VSAHRPGPHSTASTDFPVRRASSSIQVRVEAPNTSMLRVISTAASKPSPNILGRMPLLLPGVIVARELACGCPMKGNSSHLRQSHFSAFQQA
jgi:hypothetical protein